MEGKFFFTQAANLNANLFKKHPHRHTQKYYSAGYLGIT
jgi:hypothetical protein